jgi:hypothetical protein
MILITLFSVMIFVTIDALDSLGCLPAITIFLFKPKAINPSKKNILSGLAFLNISGLLN